MRLRSCGPCGEKKEGKSGIQGKKEFKEGVINCVNANVFPMFMFLKVCSI